ncbi:helix-turn-helix domain-containing protein [Candidatus Enterococcus ikei]|uniref:Helix-turn-helix domain-containing protein n=1 Tax=Candidatus Enterococcus ikei TaxID=2815326 RepID=A0ABS3H118_9ENTE|nr:helix-turn-helix domain-containing protein [Enterococcus sp. DIV0869a]MBO0441229.1 helix-turn-helix domain-containing protein [Enterococcus sp. DIV0869a]
MNKIGYNLLIDASTKRKITVLNLLLESDLPLLMSELAQICKVSPKTLRRDAQSLVELFPESVVFENSSLFLNTAVDINPVLSYIEDEVKNNILFSIVEDTFYGRSETIDYLSEKFFIAESTLRKHLSILKEVLDEFDLTLSLSPIEILGDEINIRYFYFHFFEQVADFSHNSYPEQKQADLYALLRNLTHTYGLILNVDYHRLIRWLAVSEQRIKQNKLVYLKQEIHEKYAKNDVFLVLKNAINQTLNANIYSRINDAEIIFSFLISLDTIVYDEKSYFLPNSFLSEMESFEHLATEFFQYSNLSYSLNVELKAIIKAFLVNEQALQELSPLFQKNNSDFKLLMEKKYPKTIALWNDILKNHDDFLYKEDLAASLTSLTEAKVNRRSKVLFALSGTSAETTYYKYLAHKYVPKTAELSFIFNQPIDNNLIERLDIDICICNFPLPPSSLNCTFFKFSSVPLDREWDMLAKKLTAI